MFRDTKMTRTDKAGSQQRTAVSPFLGLVSAVKGRYLTPAKKPTHIDCKMARSLYQAPYFELTYATKHALLHHVFRSERRPKCHNWCLEKKEINVAGQGQL